MNTHLSIGREIAFTFLLVALAFAACMVLAHFLDPVPPISAEPSPPGTPVSTSVLPIPSSTDTLPPNPDVLGGLSKGSP